MKKFAALFVVLVMSFGLVACNTISMKGDADPTPEPAPVEAAPEVAPEAAPEAEAKPLEKFEGNKMEKAEADE